MENKIGVGIIVGLVVAIGTLIYNSENYTTFQKKIMLPSLLFLPAGLILILIFWLYNRSENNNKLNAKSQNQKTEIPLNNLASSNKIN